MDLLHLAEVDRRRVASGGPYLEFQHSDDLSTGLYVLPAGGIDRQSPHTEDEIYYVVAGRGRILVGEEDAPVEPGDVVFVRAGVVHRFHDISADLQLLVVFGPAEGSRATGSRGASSR